MRPVPPRRPAIACGGRRTATTPHFDADKDHENDGDVVINVDIVVHVTRIDSGV
jgi:hypothetical protein